MKLRELISLQEIFDKPYPFDEKKHVYGGGSAHYYFSSPTSRYGISIGHNQKNGQGNIMFVNRSEDDIYANSGTERHTSHRVFSTIHHAVKDYIHKNPDVKSFTFSGTGKSKQKLYRGLISHVAHKYQEIPGSTSLFTVHRDDIK